MAELIFPQTMDGFTDAESMVEAFAKLQKNLNWMLSHLDSQNIQSINTSQTKVQSEDGATALDGAQLRMTDSDGTLRAILGKNTDGNFEFQLYDASGKSTLQLDETGKGVFSGQIKNSTIEGTKVRIAPAHFQNYILLENDGNEDTLALYCENECVGGIRVSSLGGMEIFGPLIHIGSASGEVCLGPGASGNFTADGKRITVKQGVITSITPVA